jgi:nitrite reductase/ring-hydroxylating ferredoxin subunit
MKCVLIQLFMVLLLLRQARWSTLGVGGFTTIQQTLQSRLRGHTFCDVTGMGTCRDFVFRPGSREINDALVVYHLKERGSVRQRHLLWMNKKNMPSNDDSEEEMEERSWMSRVTKRFSGDGNYNGENTDLDSEISETSSGLEKVRNRFSSMFQTSDAIEDLPEVTEERRKSKSSSQKIVSEPGEKNNSAPKEAKEREKVLRFGQKQSQMQDEDQREELKKGKSFEALDVIRVPFQRSSPASREELNLKTSDKSKKTSERGVQSIDGSSVFSFFNRKNSTGSSDRGAVKDRSAGGPFSGVTGSVAGTFSGGFNATEAAASTVKSYFGRMATELGNAFNEGSINRKGEKDEWYVACPKTRISPGEAVPLVVAGLDLLLIASNDAANIYCVANACPHLGTPLETGRLEQRDLPQHDIKAGSVSSFTSTQKKSCEDCIVCPLHRTTFSLETGEVRGEWTPYPPVIGKMMGAVKKESNLPTFPVRVQGKNLEVRLSSSVGDDASMHEAIDTTIT